MQKEMLHRASVNVDCFRIYFVHIVRRILTEHFYNPLMLVSAGSRGRIRGTSAGIIMIILGSIATPIVKALNAGHSFWCSFMHPWLRFRNWLVSKQLLPVVR